MCTWFLQSELPNSVILLRFTDLDLGDTKECVLNYLEVHYAQVSIKTLKYCIERL